MSELIPAKEGLIFENACMTRDNGAEYWLARDFQKILQYSTWDKFLNIIDKAKEACRNSDHDVNDHFSHAVKMAPMLRR